VLADLIRAAVQLVMRDKIVAGLVIVMILGLFFMGGNGNKDKNGHRFISQQTREGGKDGDQEASREGEQGEGGENNQPATPGMMATQSPGRPQSQGAGADQNSSPQNQALTQQMQNATAGGGAQNPQAGQNGAPGQAQPAQANPTALQPSTAVDFVRWWLSMALDYSMQTSVENHKKAMKWAKGQVPTMFKQSFYTQEVMQGVAGGTLAGSFQPVTVQAIAINPDGSVVVTVIGNLTLQSSGSQPVSQSLNLEFLVSKDAQGVRMSGFFNKTVNQTPAAQPTEVEEEVPSRRRPTY
jgi:hypothetical protein